MGEGVGRGSWDGTREVRPTDIPNPSSATGLGKSPELAESQFSSSMKLGHDSFCVDWSNTYSLLFLSPPPPAVCSSGQGTAFQCQHHIPPSRTPNGHEWQPGTPFTPTLSLFFKSISTPARYLNSLDLSFTDYVMDTLSS